MQQQRRRVSQQNGPNVRRDPVLAHVMDELDQYFRSDLRSNKELTKLCGERRLPGALRFMQLSNPTTTSDIYIEFDGVAAHKPSKKPGTSDQVFAPCQVVIRIPYTSDQDVHKYPFDGKVTKASPKRTWTLMFNKEDMTDPGNVVHGPAIFTVSTERPNTSTAVVDLSDLDEHLKNELAGYLT